MIQVGKPFYITTHKHHQVRPAAAYLAATNLYLVAWRSPTGGGRHGTFSRTLESSGAYAKTNVKLSNNDGGADARFVGKVDVTYNESDRVALVVWSQAGGGLRQGDIYGRFVAPDGTMEGDVFRISVPESKVYEDSGVKAAWNRRENRYLVVWEVSGSLGFKELQAIVLEKTGKVFQRVRIPGPRQDESYSLNGLAANHTDGEWMVVYDRYWSIVDAAGKLTAPPRTVEGIPATIRLYDAFASDASYFLVGITPAFFQELRLWAVRVSFDGTRVGSRQQIQTGAGFHGARIAYDPGQTRWMVLFSYRTSRSAPLVADARTLDMDANVIDFKPYGVIPHEYYQELNGEPDCAVNTKESQILAVWGHFRDSPAGSSWDTDHVVGAFADIRDGLIVVRNEAGELVDLASVYINGRFAGHPRHGWLKQPIRKGDRLLALAPIYQGPSHKKNHDPLQWGFDWSFQVQLSSAELGDDGTFRIQDVVDSRDNQTLVVRKHNALVGFNLVVSFEWDARTSHIDEIETKIQEASRRIFLATDGQFYVQRCTLYNNKGNWDDADIRVINSTGVSKALNHIALSTSRIRLYRLGQGGLSPGTLVHELLHYIAGLRDEYEDSSGHSAICTEKLTGQTSGIYDSGGARSACPMSGGGNGSYPRKLCSDHAENPHNQKTKQGFESCWDSLYRYYMNRGGWAESKGRWQLRRPTDRNHILEGPTDYPVSGLYASAMGETQVSKKSGALTAPLPAMPRLADRYHSGAAIHHAQDSILLGLNGGVTLLPSRLGIVQEADDPTHTKPVPPIEAQATEPGIPLLPRMPGPGVHVPSLWMDDGDRVERLGFKVQDGRFLVAPATVGHVVHATVYDPRTRTAYYGHARCTSEQTTELVLLALPVAVDIEMRPGMDGGLTILVDAGDQLSTAPRMTLLPEVTGSASEVSLALDPDSGLYVGVLEPGDTPLVSSILRVQLGLPDFGRAAWYVEYDPMRLEPGGGDLLGGDAFAELSLSDQVGAGHVLALTRATLPADLPEDRAPVSAPYRLSGSSPYIEGSLRLLASIDVERHSQSHYEILRWDPETCAWDAVETYRHPAMGYIAGLLRFVDGGLRDTRTVYIGVVGPARERDDFVTGNRGRESSISASPYLVGWLARALRFLVLCMRALFVRLRR